MSEKILVADDSPTIQKVVGITLASTDFEISPAHSVEELHNFLDSDSFDLILLDFNLSEEKEGYELCKEITEKSGAAKIIVMLGTFDSVDDNKLTEVGVSEKVIKPFESTKFIQKINDTLAGESLDSGVSPLDMPEEDSFSELSDDSNEEEESVSDLLSDDEPEEDEWSMAGPSGETYSADDESEEDDEPIDLSNPSNNELHAEMAGWGMEVPSVIGGEAETLMPPKMGEDTPANDHGADETGEWDTQEMGLNPDSPENSEEYSFEEGVNSFDNPVEETKKPSTSLVSLDELVNDDDGMDDDEDIEDTDPQIIIEQAEDDPSLEAELNSDSGSEDFWAADENYELEAESNDNPITINPTDDSSIDQHVPIDAGPKIEKVAEEVGSKEALDALNDLAKHEGEVGPKMEEVGPKMETASTVDTGDIVNQVVEQLKPQLKELIQEVIQEMSKETIEGVAWEIIPDLAENLIRNEVENLSKKVQDKHSLS